MKYIDVLDEKEGEWVTVELETFLSREGISPKECEMVRSMGPDEGLDVVGKDGTLHTVMLSQGEEVDPATADPVDDDEVDDLRP